MAQEALNHIVAGIIISSDRPCPIDAVAVGEGVKRARGIERPNSSCGCAQETVINVSCITEVPRDYSRRVDAVGSGKKRARGIEGRERAVGMAQKAMTFPGAVH